MVIRRTAWKLTLLFCVLLGTIAQGADGDFGQAPSPFFLPPDKGYCNDTFPFYWEGRWHMFMMRVPAIAHYSSKNLIDWKSHPDVAPGGATGCVVENKGTFFCFYTFNQTVYLTTSPDMEHWTPYAHNPVLTADGIMYDPGNFRDPHVFFNKEDQRWWLVICSRQLGLPAQRSACVAVATSDDLIHWKLDKPLFSPGTDPHLECPQVIREGGRWYLAMLARHTRVRYSDSLNGPWKRPPLRDLGTIMAHAGSRPASDGTRWINWPFILTPPANSTNDMLEQTGWEGGPAAVARQWTFHDDGSVTQKPADEIIEAMRKSPAGNRRPFDRCQPLLGQWKFQEGRHALSTNPNGGTLILNDYPQNVYFEADILLKSERSNFNLLMNINPGIKRGYQLTIHPDRDLVQLRHISVWDGVQSRVLESKTVKFDANKSIKLRVFRTGTVLDIFIQDQATLTYQLMQFRDGAMAMEFRDGSGEIKNMLVRQLRALLR